MKQLIIIMSFLALMSCKDKKQQTEEVPVHQDNTATVYNNAWTADMELNHNEKWVANPETNEGVLKMQNLIKTQKTGTIEDYHQLAKELNDAKNYVIKKCNMEGASHDYLHIWLVPLLNKIDALSESETLGDASRIKLSIEENINAYSNYFQ
jgi:hypothetical protein